MKLVILDRDGVINKNSDQYIKSEDEWIPIPGSLEAIARLNKAGYQVVVVSNQSGVARGYYDLATLDKMHAKMEKMLAEKGGQLSGIYFCPHHPDDDCACRKPNTGMLEQMAKNFGQSLFQCTKGNVFVGDSPCDIHLAERVGCQPALVLTGRGWQTQDKLDDFDDKWVFDDLAAVVDFVLKDEIISPDL